MKQSKDAIVLIPLALVTSFFILGIFLFVISKEITLQKTSRSLIESSFTNINIVEGELRTSLNQGRRITNPQLTQLWQERYDDGSFNEFNVLEQIVWSNQEDIAGQVQFLDRVITERRRNLERRGMEAPDKANNVFEIDLVDFLDNEGTRQGSLSNVTLDFWTSNTNTPSMYVLIGRTRKNQTLVLDEAFEEDLARRVVWGGGISNTQDFAFDFRRVDGYSGACTISDQDTGLNWCRRYPITDFISNQAFDLDRYFYKIFLVFWTTPQNVRGVPFKLTSPTGSFGLGNLTFWDLTVITPNNTKRRFIIESNERNSSLPYLVYNLWVRGQINLRDN